MAARKRKLDTRNYSLVRLYLNDLHDIEDVLRSVSLEHHPIKVSGPEYEAASVDELREEEGEGPFTIFQLESDQPYVSVRLREFDTYLSASDAHDLMVNGAVHKLDAILRRSQRPQILRFLTSAFGTMIPAILGAAIFLVSLTQDDVSVSAIAGALACAVVGLMATVWLGYTSMKRSSLVYLEERNERPSFLRRNRDQLIVGVIVGTLLWGVTFALTAFLR